ncbi:IclR family transcriptional regulator [Ovoidimarina sediminis]|uniref:IclR family transcriptional regulator n=1 Tax=Ovoidimarina sediminis TaxID=3079856 RepID=UPI0029129280|nr:IclR family transcriptional regulator [Rhodophyticola sp. MJ-SS7]MDU8944660.1 IclR family transcriptional regulator [Rhodophyticola sp. MJ-SS7]
MTSVSGSGERILAILDLFTEARPEWTPEDMMAELGYSRPTLYRYLKTLKDSGYLASLPQAGFTLGPRVTELDFLMTRADPMIRAGQPELEALAARFPGSAFLVRWYGRKLLCVASVVSSDTPKSSYPRGRPMPLGRGAASRAIVAFLPARERRKLVSEYLAQFAGAGVGTTVVDVMDALRAVRRNGIAAARGEVTPGVVAVAGPVLAGEQSPHGALCLTSDAADVTNDARLAEIGAAVRDASRRVSAALGGWDETALSPRTANDIHADRVTAPRMPEHGGTR